MTQCRVCLKPLSSYPVGQKNSVHFIACKDCGSVMADPFPMQEQIDAFLDTLKPDPTHAANPAGEMLYVKKVIARLTKDRPGRRFLDVCCRQGYAVQAARELGFEAQGIDAHEFFVQFARRHYGAEHFSHTTVADYAITGQQADVIFAAQSFCEQVDLETYAESLSKILSPKGVMYIDEPDGNSLWLSKNVDRWPFAAPPINFIYLSYVGLQSLLARHGLRLEKKKFFWTPFMRLVVTK